jgi:hypothetical protein
MIEVQAPATTKTVEQPIKPPDPSQDKQASVESFANRDEKPSESKFMRG